MPLLTNSKPLNITIEPKKERELLEKLKKRPDTEADRIRRFHAMKDLSRTEGSPIQELVSRTLEADSLKNFDVIQVPEIVSTEVGFDLFNFPENHPARSKSDTYFIDDNHILRTQTTVMWYYYLRDERIKERIDKKEAVGSVSYGKVYRKDEIDRHHMNVFHQIDGWYLVPKKENKLGTKDLQDVLVDIAHSIFGEDVKYRFNEDTFPYTHPSIEMEVEINGKWVELLGAGVVKGEVLKNLGVDQEVYNGWAFGFGLERMAIVSMELPDIRLLWSEDKRVTRQLKLGQKFKEVSKFPPVIRDISFIVPDDFLVNDYFDLIRDVGGDLIEEVEILDKYKNSKKFGEGRTSYTFRIIYRHLEKTLTNEEVNKVHSELERRTEKDFGGKIRLD